MAHRGTAIAERVEKAEPTLAFEETLRTIERARRRRSRRRRFLIAATIVLIPLLAVGTFLVTQRNVTTAVSLDEATLQFRLDRQATDKTSEPTSSSSTKEHVVRKPEAAEEKPAPASETKEVSEKSFTSTGPYTLPAEGVYTYRSTGGEQISVLGAHHEYPEEIHATVRHLGGCNWEHRNDVIAEHVDRRQWCSGSGRLSQSAQAREVEFFGQRDGSTATCDPPMLLHKTTDAPGVAFTGNCQGEGVDATIRRTYLGLEEIRIGSELVSAVRLRIVGTFTGRATGTSHEDLWVATDTGMTLRWDRKVDTNADSVFGKVHYTENASFVLTSLVPQI